MKSQHPPSTEGGQGSQRPRVSSPPPVSEGRSGQEPEGVQARSATEAVPDQGVGGGEEGGGCPAPCRRHPAESPSRCPRLTTRTGRKKSRDSRRSPPRCHRYRSFPTAQGAATAAAAGKREGWRGGGSQATTTSRVPPHTHTHSLALSLTHSHTHTRTHTTRARTTSSLQHRSTAARTPGRPPAT